MQQDKKKSYTHYMSATRPVSYPIYVQWYLYVRNGFRNFFRKSILVGSHTMTWLRIRPSKSHTSNTITTIRHIDPLLLFETPIKTRFLNLFPVPVVEEVSSDIVNSSPNLSGDLRSPTKLVVRRPSERDPFVALLPADTSDGVFSFTKYWSAGIRSLFPAHSGRSPPNTTNSSAASQKRGDFVTGRVWSGQVGTRPFLHSTTWTNIFIQCLFLPPLCPLKTQPQKSDTFDTLEEGKTEQKNVPIDPSWSSNIDTRFYDIDEFKEQMSDPKNVLEQSWKSRILYVSTPYGNVWMYYDAFKEGFAYYCDRMGLNYRLLNAIAMKYVMTYRCVDFFIDETVVSNNLSPFLARLKETDNHDLMKKKKNIKYLLGDVSSGVFNSPFLKNRPAPCAPTDVSQKITKNGSYELDKPVELYRNKFLYMGKICNANVLQTPVKKSSLRTHLGTATYSNATMPIITASSLYEATANSQMNYKSFKETRINNSM